MTLETMEELVEAYVNLLAQQNLIENRKKVLREKILCLLQKQQLTSEETLFGTATITKRFNIRPKLDKILTVLSAIDILPFAKFTSNRIKQELVPKYGREKLLTIFDYEEVPTLLVMGKKSSL